MSTPCNSNRDGIRTEREGAEADAFSHVYFLGLESYRMQKQTHFARQMKGSRREKITDRLGGYYLDRLIEPPCPLHHLHLPRNEGRARPRHCLR